MINLISRIFHSGNDTKRVLPFDQAEIAKAVKTNRASLELVDDWIDEYAFKNSWFQYGVPDFIKKDINKNIGDNTTYTDLMLVISRNYFERLNYLEIGVSVGKNFFQILNAVHGSELTGFDIEEINPVLEKKLTPGERKEWVTPISSIKKSHSSMKHYDYNDNKVKYICADVWDENSWSRLEGNKFNLIFSDALHSSEAILFEFEMLVKYGLLDKKFVIVWDDLVGKMKTAFFRIIKKYHDRFGIRDSYLLNINGWIGENETPHSVGIISNFPFE